MVSERNDAAHREPCAWSDFFPQFLCSTFENWQSKILQLLWEAAGLAMFYFWGCSLQGERRRLEAKIDRLLSEHGIGPAQFHYQEEEGVQAEA